MRPIQYHESQRAVQHEAKTDNLADKLASWVGPVVRYAALADLIVLAQQSATNRIQFTVVSGKPPLLQARESGERIHLQFPEQLQEHITLGSSVGGLVIFPSEGRRSRFSGVLSQEGQGVEIECENAFTNCRKYIAASISCGDDLRFGPSLREPVDLEDERVGQIIARAVTSFLGSITPQGMPDVSHRGGDPGFLIYDPSSKRIEWTEYLGDGMFVSMGNIRAMGKFSLLVLDLDSGDALEIYGSGNYQNIRTSRKQRVDALIQSKEPYPVQGRILGSVEEVHYLYQLCHPRQIMEKTKRVTCGSPIVDQFPD